MVKFTIGQSSITPMINAVVKLLIENNFHMIRLRTTMCQFHQRFFARFFRTNVVLAAFSSYVLALSKNSYEKRTRKMLMKLTAGEKREMKCV